MKEVYTMLNGTKVTARNQREARLARIFNNKVNDIIGWLGRDDMKAVDNSLRAETYNNWLIQELDGMASAMYFMDMISNPMCDTEIWRMVVTEYNKTHEEAPIRNLWD